MNEKKVCLVLEDSEVIREIAARIVEDLGLQSAQAGSAADGVAYCAENTPAVVLLDWDLPSMGALDFLRGASELTSDTKPAIILCATENDPQQFTLAKAAGAAHHILKPFDRESIEAALQEAGVIDSVGSGAAAAANQ
ncbi:MAG: response regulator [Pseudomonadota bacterium]